MMSAPTPSFSSRNLSGEADRGATRGGCWWRSGRGVGGGEWYYCSWDEDMRGPRKSPSASRVRSGRRRRVKRGPSTSPAQEAHKEPRRRGLLAPRRGAKARRKAAEDRRRRRRRRKQAGKPPFPPARMWSSSLQSWQKGAREGSYSRPSGGVVRKCIGYRRTVPGEHQFANFRRHASSANGDRSWDEFFEDVIATRAARPLFPPCQAGTGERADARPQQQQQRSMTSCFRGTGAGAYARRVPLDKNARGSRALRGRDRLLKSFGDCVLCESRGSAGTAGMDHVLVGTEKPPRPPRPKRQNREKRSLAEQHFRVHAPSKKTLVTPIISPFFPRGNATLGSTSTFDRLRALLLLALFLFVAPALGNWQTGCHNLELVQTLPSDSGPVPLTGLSFQVYKNFQPHIIALA